MISAAMLNASDVSCLERPVDPRLLSRAGSSVHLGPSHRCDEGEKEVRKPREA